MVLARFAEAIGSALLRMASRLLRYAERQHGAQVSPPLPPDQLPIRVQVLVEELIREEPTPCETGIRYGKRIQHVEHEKSATVLQEMERS